jgi:hypothetical protein
MTTTCDATWHQHFLPDGDVVWFKLLDRFGDLQGTYLYAVANERGSAIWTKIWARNGVAWTCHACGTTLSKERRNRAGV